MTKMRPIRDTIPIDEARAIIATTVRPIERVERVPLRRAGGRVLARETVPYELVQEALNASAADAPTAG